RRPAGARGRELRPASARRTWGVAASTSRTASCARGAAFVVRSAPVAPHQRRRIRRDASPAALPPLVHPRHVIADIVLARPCGARLAHRHRDVAVHTEDRKSTRLNSSHVKISYAVFCLKKKTNTYRTVAMYA